MNLPPPPHTKLSGGALVDKISYNFCFQFKCALTPFSQLNFAFFPFLLLKAPRGVATKFCLG